MSLLRRLAQNMQKGSSIYYRQRQQTRTLHGSMAATQKTIKDQLKDMTNTSKGDSRGSSASDYFVNLFDRGPNVGIEVITKQGFVLSNNVQVSQPLILLNGSAFLWKAPLGTIQSNEWDMDSLSIFDLVMPKPELILFGTGSQFVPLPPDVRKHFYQMGVQVDIMTTKHAAATYNVLAEEGRRVAAALLPVSGN